MAWFDDPAVQQWEYNLMKETLANPYDFVNPMWGRSDALGIILKANLEKRNFPFEIAPEDSRYWIAELLARKESLKENPRYKEMIAEEAAKKQKKEAEERAARELEEKRKREQWYWDSPEGRRHAHHLRRMAGDRYEDVVAYPKELSGRRPGEGRDIFLYDVGVWNAQKAIWEAEKKAHEAAQKEQHTVVNSDSRMPRFGYGFK